MTSKQTVSTTPPLLENLLFRLRPLLLLTFFVATLLLLWQASQLHISASFEKNIPKNHEYIANYLEHRDDLKGLGNAVRIVLSVNEGNIFTADYMDTLKEITDEAFYMPGVDRTGLKSLWTPNVRWMEVTEDGLAGGEVMPADYDASVDSIETIRKNTLRSGQVGRLVANNLMSSIIYVPLLEKNPETGKKLDYQQLSALLEKNIRDKYNSKEFSVHITGFAKMIGDLIDGASLVVQFFVLAIAITFFMLIAYSRCIRSTLLTLGCAIIAVTWQLGLLNVLGKSLDPYSMLLPFLIFAIAVSHGVQLVNAAISENTPGTSRLTVARLAFRSLYIAGLIALISDALGFATLMIIDIDVIHDLAVAASIGVAAILLTNLILLPLLLSYIGVREHNDKQLVIFGVNIDMFWSALAQFTKKAPAVGAIVAAFLLSIGALWITQDLKVGDLDKGAPALKADSRYNKDIAYIVDNYSTSTDVMVVMVKTPPDQCISYTTLAAVDYFQHRIQNVEGVQLAQSLTDHTKYVLSALNEANLKWQAISRNQLVLNSAIAGQSASSGLFNADCSLLPVLLFLSDHKAETLSRVTDAVRAFVEEVDTGEDTQFLLAAGNAGIEAATNIVVTEAQTKMLLWIYGVVAFLVLLSFRSWRIAICIIAPLALTSLLCQALMVYLNIGIKVATLPVIALGVGIGVDYGIYIYSKLNTVLQRTDSLTDAYLETLRSTGKAVFFTALTLAISVATWSFSPIKFQADMGLLLTFMFLWNMVGALVLIPALSFFLIDRKRILTASTNRM